MVSPVNIRICNYLLPRGRQRGVNEILEKADLGPDVIRFSFADKLVDANGVTRPELFDQERLHLTDAGYVIWRKAVEPFFKKYCGK